MLVLYLSLLVVAVNGYKSGAPVVACDSMTPGHNVEAQIGPSRHSFTTSKSIVYPGEELTVTLKSFSQNDDFKGFFIQARDPRTQKAVGEFLTDYSSDVAKVQPVDCHSLRRSSLTHKDPSLKNSVIAKWKAPYYLTNNTEFRFYYTVVREFNTFWVKQESQTVLYRSGSENLAAQTVAVLAGLVFTLVLRKTHA